MTTTGWLAVLVLGVATTAVAPPGAAPPPDATTATVRALPPLGPAPTPPVAQGGDPLGSARADAPPGLRRCVRPDGSSVFTDRRCDSQDATPDGVPAGEPAPASTATTQPAVVRVRTCARSQGDLLERVRMALEARDANRFAEFYHWTGMDNTQGYQVMGRLMRFTEHPLVDVQLVSSAAREAPSFPSPFEPEDPDRRFEASAATPGPARPADLLRVDQLRGDDSAESQTTWFHLRSNAGCWWLQF